LLREQAAKKVGPFELFLTPALPEEGQALVEGVSFREVLELLLLELCVLAF
jgi:hypothetical protein